MGKVREIAFHGDSPEKRERAASMAYQAFGVITEWVNAAGTKAAYIPSNKDIQLREEFHRLEEQGRSVHGDVEQLLQQTRGLLILNLVSLGLTILALGYRRKKINALGGLLPVSQLN